ncbi:MAG: NusG domain II-containing protein [Clostridia bacterium]|nr:NusG domain II-containing protein [Clostridia bacterium]
MSLKKIESVKKDRGFKIWDLIIYGVIIALVVITFTVVFTTRDTSPLSGIRIYSKGVAVFEYSFENGKYNILSDANEIEVSDNGESLTVKITSGKEYNLVEIVKSGSVSIKEANCHSLDCVYMPAIKDNSGFIYCSPHALRIVPFNFDPDDGNIIV